MSNQTIIPKRAISHWDKLSKLIIYCAVLLATTTFAHAQTSSYSVQVGAFSSPSPTLADKYKQYGSVKIAREAGLTRVLIGVFQSRDDAELLLMELQREGFADAFVRRTVAATAAIATTATPEATPDSHGHAHLPAQDQRRINQLSDAERARAVYLDGVLHLKEGDTFTPVQ